MSDPLLPPEPISEELTRLANRYCEDALSDPEARRLEGLLRDPPAQQLFLAYLDIHARLCWEFGAGLAAPPRQPDGSSVSKRTRFFRLGGWAASFAALLLVVLWLALRGQKIVPPPERVSVAQVTRSLAARWAGQQSPVAPGDVLEAGLLDLEQGLVEITFTEGAVALLEAPVQLELVSPGHAFLHSGRVVARVPRQAVGFTIETAKAKLVDLGTEFGVRADSPGNTLVQVFAGEVIAEAKSAGAEKLSVRRLKTGQAWAIDDTPAGARPRELPFVPQRFLRTFPAPPRREGPAIPYNESKLDTVHVLPAPARPVVDGDLSDWDRRGMFHSACTAPYGETYYVEGMMMYDAEHLYLGGHVGDPYPLRNRVDPSTDPLFFWAGGSVVVRLSTDKALGWPLQGIAFCHPRAGRLRVGRRPEDVSERIVHVGMWYTQPDRKPHLYLAYGMDSHGRVFDPDRWRGVFRQDADGRGYVFEYAIPWSLLHAASDPPQPGDTLAAAWHVHWSDEDGRTCFGQLVEITNPAEKPYHFQVGPTWGKAIYHRDRDFPARDR